MGLTDSPRTWHTCKRKISHRFYIQISVAVFKTTPVFNLCAIKIRSIHTLSSQEPEWMFPFKSGGRSRGSSSWFLDVVNQQQLNKRRDFVSLGARAMDYDNVSLLCHGWSWSMKTYGINKIQYGKTSEFSIRHVHRMYLPVTSIPRGAVDGITESASPKLWLNIGYQMLEMFPW